MGINFRQRKLIIFYKFYMFKFVIIFLIAHLKVLGSAPFTFEINFLIEIDDFAEKSKGFRDKNTGQF